ncbi:ubiquitin carboxyl-terminal hydrolase 32-like [Brachyistius frenatus]|uniref:ubiquitin carboxyl-terminal hydrolase 32-like n=1 Tax=Brachyistius frenatus TaxID=100188 RepID=UPI0037E7D9A8
MGAKESRIGFLSYDEAVKRVTDVELKRLKDAFKRTSGLSYYMTQQCFYREVLGDGVPPKVAEVSHSKATFPLSFSYMHCRFKMLAGSQGAARRVATVLRSVHGWFIMIFMFASFI